MSWVAAKSVGRAPFCASLQRRCVRGIHETVHATNVSHEIRARNPRMSRDGANRAPALVRSSLQFEREPEIGQLRVLIGRPSRGRGRESKWRSSKWIIPRRCRITTLLPRGRLMKGKAGSSARRVQVVSCPIMQFEVVDGAKGRRHHDPALLIKTSRSPVHSRRGPNRLQVGQVEGAGPRRSRRMPWRPCDLFRRLERPGSPGRRGAELREP